MQESLDFKNKLISIVAHDIRNPVASIRGMLQLYNQGLVKNDELISWMDGLETAVANVDLLLENLLNWVKMQRGTIKAKFTQLNLIDLVKQTASELKSQLDLKRIELDQSDITKQKVTLSSDKNILAFAIRNVLSNAIKFSEEASAIQIQLKEEDDRYRLSIIDHGQGMSAQKINEIFSSQTQSTEGTKTEKGSGMGIGLSIEFLKAMGASLEIDSQLGKGTEVSILLPKSN